jgi:hypothetical protein
MAGLLAGGAIAKKKKKKKAKPVATTLFLHGSNPSGDVEGAQWLVDYLANSQNNPMVMDSTEPADGAPKSMNLHNPALNTQCTGLPAGFPTWVGDLAGTIKGDAKLTVDFLAAPTTTVTARLWPDILPFAACNDAYIAPAAEVTVDVPEGQNSVEIIFKKVKIKSAQTLMLELIGGRDAEAARVFYDSSDFASKLEFKCLPAKGKKCV